MKRPFLNMLLLRKDVCMFVIVIHFECDLCSFKEAIQPTIHYQATPYPFVTNTTNITLICVGRAVDYETNPRDPKYMTKVEITRNKKRIKSCERFEHDKVRNLSCDTTVTGVNSSDQFDCNIYATRAPCNGARIIFEVQSKFLR